MNPDLELLRPSPFVALRVLLEPLTPNPALKPLTMTIGEPQNQPPEFMKKVLKEQDHLYEKYPPNTGSQELRDAITGWLNRRFSLPADMVDADRHITPVNGTKEALYMLAQLLTNRAETGGEKPAILLPNPYYHVYYAAAVMAGAEPILLHATKETNFMPDLEKLDEALLERTTAFYLCNPSNPQGTAADKAYLEKALTLSKTYNFTLIVDECYTEIYDREPPIGILEILKERGDTLDGVMSFHSLSKRSSAAGLRSGFIVGDASITKAFLNLRNFAGAASPLPVGTASAALWQEDEHVAANRTRYRRNIDIAERYLEGRFDFYRPPGGFFLWLNVEDGVTAAKKLWTEAAVRVIPGEYLSVTDEKGFNPGKPYIRVALVHDPEIMEEALSRLANVL